MGKAGQPGHRYRKRSNVAASPRIILPRRSGAAVLAAALLAGMRPRDYAQSRMGESVQAILAGGVPLPLDLGWVASPPNPDEGLTSVPLSAEFAEKLRQAASVERLSLRQMGEKYLVPQAHRDLKNAIANL